MARIPETAAWQTALSELTLLRADEERAEQALRVALEHARSRAGFLFTVHAGSAVLIAPRHGEEPPDSLLERVHIAAQGGTQVAEQDEPEDTRVENFTSPGTEAQYTVHVLEDEDGDNVVGVLALLVQPVRMFRAPRPEFLRALGAALFPKASTQTREEQQKARARS
jgi:hypothetical protein